MTKTDVPVAEARSNFSEIINRVRYGQQQAVAITRRGRVVAAVISADDMIFLSEAKQRYISHQFVTLEATTTRVLKDKRVPDLRILGINALGPLHQGREAIINVLAKGGRLKLLLLNPLESAFRKTMDRECDTVGRLEAELYASFHIVMDITSKGAAGQVAIRLHNREPDRSLIIVNGDDDDGVVMENPYPRRKGMRGLTGKMYEWHKNTDGRNDYDENRDYFNMLWDEALPIELVAFTQRHVKEAVSGQSSTENGARLWPFLIKNDK